MLYWSDSVNRPEKGGYEEKTKNSNMEIASRSSLFVAKEIYIAAQALTDAKFEIEIAFQAFAEDPKRKRLLSAAAASKQVQDSDK